MSGTETVTDSDDIAKIQAEDRVSEMLVNVFGLKLPNELYSQAARSSAELANILQEYGAAIEKPKQR